MTFPPLGIPEPIATSGAELGTLLLGFAVFAAAFLGWLLVRMTQERITFDTVLCPSRNRVAQVTFRRTWDGTRLDVVHCSLLGRGGPVTCRRQCLRESTRRRSPALGNSGEPRIGARAPGRPM
jgi:hypothetical protein